MALSTEDMSSLNSLYRNMRGSSDFSVYVFGGKEGDRQSYVAKIRYVDISRHFSPVPINAELSKNLMLQRDLVRSRALNIKRYILGNKDFVFPEVIAVCESFNLKAVDGAPNLYLLTLPAIAFRYLVDGQGRLSGISDALSEDASLADQTIDIKFLKSRGLVNDSQLFSDFNTTPVAPNKSQCAAMDSRKAVNRFAKHVIDAVPDLSPLFDYTKASVTASSTSSKLWTLNQFVAFVLMVTGTTAKSCENELGTEAQQQYWTGFIAKFFSILRQNDVFDSAINGNLPASQVRESTIIGTSVFLKSVALMGKVLVMNFIAKGDVNVDWSIMDKWQSIDLSRSNKEWLGRCMNYRGGYEDKSFNHKAMASYFLSEMGINMPEELECIEEEVLLCRAAMLKAKREEEKVSNDDIIVREVA